jgi:hypothetical protein
MSIEAMKQALEALENSYSYLPVKTGVEHDADKAITELRKAIEQTETNHFGTLEDMFEACGIGIGFGDAKLKSTGVTHIYSTGVPMAKPDISPKQPKPVGFRNIETGEFCTGGFLRNQLGKWQPLYTAPPKREWVGLTDHELQVLDYNDRERGKLARAVDAKLKERNT